MKGMCGEKSSYSILLLLSVGAFKIFQVLFFYIKIEKAGVGDPSFLQEGGMNMHGLLNKIVQF